ncbi:hypothetical protein [Streptomyces acidiscabies]|uniref:DUF4199 domain-containing protein n=1 Tax=Streptomyces acidiscabies TaxID=42234 RepID=A0A0L0JK31_9ACTN|nr:hypothetical protein [Streptomyces acidiscabies]KND26052.1 hypothetical protein IQ63_38075 [Streptomyces acidiscabies]
MDNPRGTRHPASADASQAGVIGIGLAAVLTFALAVGSWQWFATYTGVTLIAVIVSFCRLPAWESGVRSAYARSLAAYSLVVGLCAAIALAPALQRWSWLFPMPDTRDRCPALGTYERLRAEAELGELADRGRGVLAQVGEVRAEGAVADCLSATTTLWLPVYAAGVAVLVGVAAWLVGRRSS